MAQITTHSQHRNLLSIRGKRELPKQKLPNVAPDTGLPNVVSDMDLNTAILSGTENSKERSLNYGPDYIFTRRGGPLPTPKQLSHSSASRTAKMAVRHAPRYGLRKNESLLFRHNSAIISV